MKSKTDFNLEITITKNLQKKKFMRPYKKLAEQRAASKSMTNKGRTKAFVRGFEDAMEFLKEMQDKGLVDITFNF